MKLLTPYLLIFSLALFVFSCKDKEEEDKNNGGSNKPKQELLVQKNWKITGLISSGTDIWAFVESCSKDNEYKFRTDDSLVLFDKNSKCDVSDPDSTVSSYKLLNDTKLILNVKLTGSITLNDTADIIELNDNTMKLNAEYSGFPATIIFQHP